MRIHAKKNNCTHCLYRAESKEELDTHIDRRHSIKYECDWCDFVHRSKEGITKHEKEDHKIQKKKLNCNKCDNTYKSTSDLNRHLETSHSQRKTNIGDQRRTDQRRTFSAGERKRNGICRFWNNSQCTFGESCTFFHQEAPFCRFQESCRDKYRCQFFHGKDGASSTT